MIQSKDSFQFSIPFHVGAYKNDEINQLAIDSALIALKTDKNIKTWGETQNAKPPDSLLTPVTSFTHLEQQVIFILTFFSTFSYKKFHFSALLRFIPL